MMPFSEIQDRAEQRKGGAAALKKLLTPATPLNDIRKIKDSRWLSTAMKCVFQAGFSWKVVENKWPRFEEVFGGFDLPHCAMLSDEDLDKSLSSGGIVANYAKIKSIRDNAQYFLSLANSNTSIGAFFTDWSRREYGKNIIEMRKLGARLGGNTGLLFLRRMGIDSFIFSDPVVRALHREDIINRMPTSGKDFSTLQFSIDQWTDETGLSMTHMSQILAYSTD